MQVVITSSVEFCSQIRQTLHRDLLKSGAMKVLESIVPLTDCHSGEIFTPVLLLDSPMCDVRCQVAGTGCWTIQQQHWRRNFKRGTFMDVFPT